LINRDFIQHVITANIDGLHYRSGLDRERFSEINGNMYIEYCTKCRKEYARKYDVLKTVHKYLTHLTGRKCLRAGCGGYLRDNIVHMGEHTNTREICKAQEHAEKSDLSLVLGTSLRVKPASTYGLKPLERGGKLVIVNLQETPHDDKAFLIVRTEPDYFMKKIMEKLHIEEFDQQFDTLK
jgi:mono-ADP-ribosyltransferase sirtuin 6